MKIRPYTNDDFSEVKSLIEHNQDFQIPDLANPLYALKEVALDHKGQIIAVGIVRITSEVILIIDKQRPIFERMQALKKLLKMGVDRSKDLGLDEWHAFTDEKFAKLLEKFNFKRVKGASLFRGFYG